MSGHLSLVALVALALAACRTPGQSGEPGESGETPRDPVAVAPSAPEVPGELRERAAELRVFAFELRPRHTLRLVDFDGDVRVIASEREAPEIFAHLGVYGRTRSAARRHLAAIRFDTKTENGERILRLERPEVANLRTHSSYDVWVPYGTKVRVDTSHGDVQLSGPLGASDVKTAIGDVTVSSIAGAVTVRNQTGRIRIVNVKGPSVTVNSVHGNVELTTLAVGSVEAITGSGDVAVADSRAKSMRFETNHGALRFEHVSGTLAAKSDSGSIELYGVAGPTLVLDTEFGDVRVRGAAGRLVANARSGSIDVEHLEGELEATTGIKDVRVEGILTSVIAQSGSGRIEAIAHPGSRTASAWLLRSDYGDVVLELPANFACTLDVRSDQGRIQEKVALVVEANAPSRPDRVRGILGSGGRPVRLMTGAGNIEVRQSKTPGAARKRP